MQISNSQPLLANEDLTEYLTNLTDNTLLKERQKAAEKAVQGYTTEEWKDLRQLAKHDLFFLCSGVLGFKRLSTRLHGNLCKWCTHTDNEQFREILLPRGTFKSSVVTIGDGVRIALPDDNGTSPWPRNLGTNVRVALTHEVERQASRFLGAITGHFMSNPILMGLFPECVPVPRVQVINTTQLELPRTEIWVEATFEAFNVGARGQGKHYNFLKLDDLIGDASRDSQTVMQSAKDWFDNIQSFFSSFMVDHFDLIGTRWALDDLYEHAHTSYGSSLVKYIRGIEEKNAAGERVSIFPEEFPLEKLAVLRKNQKVFNAQYANDPLAGATEFEQGWKKFYEWESESKIKYSGGSVLLSSCDIIILIDPAMVGNAGYVITANDPNDNIFIIKAKKHNWKPPELVEEIFLDVQRYNPRLVAIEAVLFSELFHHWILSEQARRDIRFRIEPYSTRQKLKDARIRGLSTFFSSGRIHMHSSQVDLIDEFDAFGAKKGIHILDALAQGPEYWRRGMAIRRAGEIANQLIDRNNNRDVITGYSKI